MATYNFTVRAEDDRGAYSDRTFSIQVQNNLVDRMLVITPSDAYASVDGVNFTKRTDAGGYYTHYLLNKWVVVNGHSYYRVSKDTINWTAITTRLKTNSSIPELDGSTFYTDLSCLYEYAGTVYAIGKFWHNVGVAGYDNRFYVFTTTDLENWDVIPESTNILGRDAYKMVDHFSNITRYKGEFLFYSADGSFYTTPDFKTFTTHAINDITATPLNNLRTLPFIDQRSMNTMTTGGSFATITYTYNQFKVIYFRNIRLSVVNDVTQLVFAIVRTLPSYSNATGRHAGQTYFSHLHGCVYTTDLRNINIPLASGLSSPSTFNTISEPVSFARSYTTTTSSTVLAGGIFHIGNSSTANSPTTVQLNDLHRTYFTFSHTKPIQYVNGDIYSQIPFIGGLLLDNPLSISKHQNTISNDYVYNKTTSNGHPAEGTSQSTDMFRATTKNRYIMRGAEVLFNGNLYAVHGGYIHAPIEKGSLTLANNTTTDHPLLSNIAPQISGQDVVDIAVRR